MFVEVDSSKAFVMSKDGWTEVSTDNSEAA
jgi:hypothetical protein